MNFFTKETKIGITAIIAIVIIYVGIILLKGLSLFSSDKVYTVVMDNVSGISISSDVLANGLKVGYVKAINYDEESQDLFVSLNIDPDFPIPSGTTVFVSKEMLGQAKLNLELGKYSSPLLSAGDTIYSTEATDLMSAAEDIIPEIQNLIPVINSILNSLNKLISDPALTATLSNLESTSANLKTMTKEINALMHKDVPQLLTSANQVMSNAETLTQNINQIDIAGIANNANQTLANANNITNKLNTSLNSKDNTLGLLLNDNSLALHIDTTIINASLLLEDLRLHPKRYVHFSVFGKKEKEFKK
ncbi:MAG: MCE family protein [Bacteroidaceae bacterium]|nr:MCE family protein [Bacteroidaceae bacterium]